MVCTRMLEQKSSRVPSGVMEPLYQSWTACLQIFLPERKTSFCEVTPRLFLNNVQMHQTLNNTRGFILVAETLCPVQL